MLLHLVFFLSVVIFVSGIDQFVKWLIIKNFSLGYSVKLIPSVLNLTLTTNQGIAFGLLKNFPNLTLMVGLSVVAILTVYVIFVARDNFHSLLLLSFITGGATSNIIDRIFRGYIVDYIDVHIWPVFNLADVFICCGSFGLLLNYICCRKTAPDD
jgi:signal peptidase II